MKKLRVSVITVLVLVIFLVSCVSLEYKQLTQQEKSDASVLGSVEVQFDSWQVFHIPNNKKIKQIAYNELLRAAQQQYQGNIDIANIKIEGSSSFFNLANIAGYLFGTALVGMGASFMQDEEGPGEGITMLVFGIPLLLNGNTQKITATGDVVTFSIGSGSGINQQLLNNALSKAADRLIDELKMEVPRRTTVAILSVYSDDRTVSSYAIEKIEQQFHDSRHFTIIERRFIDEIRREKRLQESDDIDQATAAEYAREKGWNIVVIGEITGTGSSRRLVLRAIHAEHNTILSRAMEQL